MFSSTLAPATLSYPTRYHVSTVSSNGEILCPPSLKSSTFFPLFFLFLFFLSFLFVQQGSIGRLIEKIAIWKAEMRRVYIYVYVSQFVCQSLLFRRRDEKKKGNTFLRYWRVLFQWKIRYTVFENKILSLSRIFKKDYYFFYSHLHLPLLLFFNPIPSSRDERREGWIYIDRWRKLSLLSIKRTDFNPW